MPSFTAKYTTDQREAFVSAVIDRGCKAPRVVELAAAGELTTPNGDRLEPFNVPAATIRSEARRARDRRMGKQASQLAQAEPRDAVEALRRRLINAADGMLHEEERKPANKRDPQRLREIGRCVREFGAIPGPKEAAPRRPGDRENGKQPEGTTRAGLGGEILKAHRSQTATNGKGKPHTSAATQEQGQDTGAQQGAAHNETEAQERTDAETPGSSQRSLATRLVPAQ